MDKTQMAIEVFSRRAVIYQEKFMDVSSYHDTLDVFCDNLSKTNSAILELACGPGNITRYLLTRRPDFSILATDLSPAMLSLAEANNPSAKFQLLDCRAIGMLTQKYDGIVCGFCLPYLCKEDALKLIADAAALLSAGGLLYISTMEDDYDRSGMQTSSQGDKLYMYFHECDYLATAIEYAALEILTTRHQEYHMGDKSKMTDLIFVARKK